MGLRIGILPLQTNIVAYRDCGLSSTEIDQSVGQNQATAMHINHRWMQGETTDQRGRLHLPRCTTARDDRQTGRMEVKDRAGTSRIIAQLRCLSVSVHAFLRRLQQNEMSARRPLLRLPLTGKHRRLPTNGGMNGGHGQRNGMTFCLLTNPAFACNIAMVRFEYGDTVIELLPLPACSPAFSAFKNAWSMLAQRLARNTSSTTTPDQLWQYVEAAWTAVPQGYIQSLFDSMSRCVVAVIANNGGYINY
ncbi:HTH_38 domain-containing protein [Trichonephila clavipes]|nr:HTH_38 domain-containing protein [Trichonephila clavipes]